MRQPQKILAIQFKYFGDTALMVPALRAIRESDPSTALHALVPEEVAPVLQHLRWLTRVWPMPRQRGRARFTQAWPLLRALRAERFDRSVDFGGNDRGAILSLLCGARQRLGPVLPGGFVGRRFCYTHRIAPASRGQHETWRLIHILSAWGIAPPGSTELEIHTDPALDDFAKRALPERKIICHLAAGQSKKEWPIIHWAALWRMATAAGHRLAFSTGTGPREQSLLNELTRIVPDASALSQAPDLATFLAMLKRAELFISGDTGPMHFAAGLGVPTIALFGPTSAAQWAPAGERHQFIQGVRCWCEGAADECSSAGHCLAAISPEQVLARLAKAVKAIREKP